jgi:hypothetical protein
MRAVGVDESGVISASVARMFPLGSLEIPSKDGHPLMDSRLGVCGICLHYDEFCLQFTK